jgi:hypothetical protein
LSVWLINALYRFGVRGYRERDDDDRARTSFDENGYWPDEDPPNLTQPARAAPLASSRLTADGVLGYGRAATGTAEA